MTIPQTTNRRMTQTLIDNLYTYQEDTSNANVTVIAAPTDGKSIYVCRLKLNVKTAEDLTVKSGATILDKFYLGDVSGVVIDYGDRALQLAPEQALIIGKIISAATALSVSADYFIG